MFDPVVLSLPRIDLDPGRLFLPLKEMRMSLRRGLPICSVLLTATMQGSNKYQVQL